MNWISGENNLDIVLININIYIYLTFKLKCSRSSILVCRNALDEITEKYRRERALGITQYLFAT